MASHPTIKDVAKKAGVSITTVSFVLNRRSDMSISQAVRERVLQAARDLDYHPSAMAAGLAGKRTKNIGLVFYQQDRAISNQFYSHVIEGIVQAALEKEFNLLFSYIAEAYEGPQNLPRIVQEKYVDGVLLLWRSHPKLAADILARGIPVVAIDPKPALEGVDTIQMDNRTGGKLAGEHLIFNGHRKIGLLTAAEFPSFQEREEGFREAHAKTNVKFNESLRFQAPNLSFWGAYEVGQAFLKKAKGMTAIFCANDEMAAGLLRAAHKLGRRVPEDLSVVGFDNITMTNYTDPPLTTLSPAKAYMGKLAVSRILEAVEAGGSKSVLSGRHDVPVELIIRESTRKIR